MRIFKMLPILLLPIINPLFGQSPEYPSDIAQYSFINYNANKIFFFEDSSDYERLFTIYDDIILEGTGKINIVHIGGSHIQADIYTNRMRQHMQNFYPACNGGRGFLFPFRVARTNNPYNYHVNYTGHWESCRNVERKKNCTLGLAGISVTTFDTTASITIIPFKDSIVKYKYNSLKVFHNFSDSEFDFDVSMGQNCSVTENQELGYSEIQFPSLQDSIHITFAKTDSFQNEFTLYGFYAENDDPGIVYNSIGVNGASVPSFLRCKLLPQHIQAINPDLVVLSIGTNDAYTRRFHADVYEKNYDSLIIRIKQVLPNAAIMITVPNDSYLYRRYVNTNTKEVRDAIYRLAKKYHCGVWDFYKVMGGLNSIYIWYKLGLAKYDKVHFTRAGYYLKGDLFFNAFLKAYENHIDVAFEEYKYNTEKSTLEIDD